MWLLFKKQLYDLKHKILLYIALFLIILVGMVFYSGFATAKNDISSSISEFYQEANLATYTIKTPSTFKNSELERFLANFDERSYDLVYNEMNYSSTDIFYHRNSFNTNRYEVVKGSDLTTNKRDILLDYDYANANNYHVDDYIIINNKAYHIVGLAKFPNHIFKGNYFPDCKTSFIAINYEEDLTKFNIIYLDSDMSEIDLTNLVNTSFTNPSIITITYQTNDYGYQRVKNDLALVNSILFIFPLACFISIVIILFINYNKIIEEQKPYLGILKANGFSLFKIYLSLLIIPVILALISALIGSFIGVKTIPNLYIKIIGAYYALPPITSSNLFLSVVLPLLVLIIVTILTISIPILLSLYKEPVALLKTKAESKFGRTFLRRVKLPYHLKLVVRNIITSKRKNICLIIASSLLLGIVIAVFFISDSLKYSAETLAEETFNGEFILDIADFKPIEESDLIEDTYFYTSLGIKTELNGTNETLYIFEKERPSIKLKDEKGNLLDLTKDGIYVSTKYLEDGYKIGDTITIWPNRLGFTESLNIPIAGFFEEVGIFKYAISLETLTSINPNLTNYINVAKQNIPPLIKIKDGKTKQDLENYIHKNYKFVGKVSKLGSENKDLQIKRISDLYQTNADISKFDLSKYNIINTYDHTSKQIIILNNDLNILTLDISSPGLRENIRDDGIYLPESLKDSVKDGKITIYTDKKTFTLNVIDFVPTNTCYATFTYLKTIKGFDTSIGSTYYEIKDTSKIPDLEQAISNNNVYNSYTITDINTFGERLGVIDSLITVTKYISTILAAIIFVLLVYNIGAISLNNRLLDIRVFKTAGLKDRKLKHLLSIENLVVVVIASLISIPIGILIANSILNDIYEIASVNMVLHPNYLSMFIIIVIALILISITSFLINQKIKKLNLAKLLKEE